MSLNSLLSHSLKVTENGTIRKLGCGFLFAFHSPRRTIVIAVGMEKLEWRGYLKVKKFDDMFRHFDRIPASDGRTDGRTDFLRQHNLRHAMRSIIKM